MLTILEGSIKRLDDTWNWMEQATLLIPDKVKRIKRFVVTPVLAIRDASGNEGEHFLPGLVNCGSVSIYLNDEKIGEQVLVDNVFSSKMPLNSMMRNINKEVTPGMKIIITPTSSGVFLNPYNIYIKVIIEY